MQRYEYRVIQATDIHPQGFWRKALEKTASAITERLNEQGRDGWEFQRAELLRMPIRGRLGGMSEHEIDVLIFRRPVKQSRSAPIAAGERNSSGTSREKKPTGALRRGTGGVETPPLTHKERGSS